ncbi:MAG: OmpA family protein [Elusimicrobiaceae bacterium]|nr:OmpA family protein [Elusimicrobiaceae bacterium]
MKKVMIILAAALFLGACHCSKCTTTPNRSNTCKAACKCAKCDKNGCVKPVVAKPAPAPVVAKPATVADDNALQEVAKVSKKADNVAVLSFKEPINFAYNSDAIEKDSYAQIQKTANVLKKYPNAKVRVAGYTDSLGDDNYNVDLSQRRAKAVAMQLVKDGVDAQNVSFIGFGEANPVATNKTAAGRAQNRRVELEVTNK